MRNEFTAIDFFATLMAPQILPPEVVTIHFVLSCLAVRPICVKLLYRLHPWPSLCEVHLAPLVTAGL
jgi:hypothetical protein